MISYVTTSKLSGLDDLLTALTSLFFGLSRKIRWKECFPNSVLRIGSFINGYSSLFRTNSYHFSPRSSCINEMLPFALPTYKGLKTKL